MHRQRPPFKSDLKRLMIAAGYQSQRELGRAVGVEQQAVSAWLNGSAVPTGARQVLLAGLLGVSVHELCKITGWPAPEDSDPGDDVPATSSGPAREAPTMYRADLIRTVVDWLTGPGRQPRLISITGAPGMGKTTLAAAIATAVTPVFGADRIYRVEYVGSPVENPASHLLQGIMSALRLAPEGNRPPLLTIARRLNMSEHRSLLVLDAVEAVAPALPLLEDLVERCPELRVLMTSTTRLDMRCQEVHTPPLAYPHLPRRVFHPKRAREEARFFATGVAGAPDAMFSPEPPRDVLLHRVRGHLGPSEGWRTNDAIRLFVERARASNHDLPLNEETYPAIALICHRLQGVPLAIELAAASAYHTPDPRDILANLGDQLVETPRAPVERAYHALGTDEDRALLRRLSLLPGRFTLQTAVWFSNIVTKLGVRPPANAALVHARLSRLLRANLLASAPGDGPAYRMLDTIRSFAAAELTAEHESDAAREQLARGLLAIARDGEQRYGLLHGGSRLNQVDELWECYRSTLTWAMELHLAELGAPMAGALWWYFDTRGVYDEGAWWLQRAIACCAEQNLPAPGELWFGLGVMAYRQGNADRAAHALHMARADERFLDANGSLGRRYTAAFLGLVAEEHRDLESAAALHAECTNLSREANDTFVLAGSLTNEGEIALARGQLENARSLLDQGYPLCVSLQSGLLLGRTAHAMGRLALRHGETATAHREFINALRHAALVSDPRLIAISLEGLAMVAVLLWFTTIAIRLYAAAEVVRDDVGAPRLVQHEDTFAPGVAAIRERLPDGEIERAWQEARDAAQRALTGFVWERGWRASLPDFMTAIGAAPLMDHAGPVANHDNPSSGH